MENRVKKTISEILGLNIEDINDETSPETVEVWDSLKHMNIIIALEDEFNIEFADDEIAELNSLSDINLIIKNRL